MKTTEFYGAYEAPVIEMETIAVEKGFAASDIIGPGDNGGF